MDDIFSYSPIGFDFNAFLDLVGTSPFAAMWYLTIHGGWIVFAVVILWGARALYLDYIQGRTIRKKQWIVLRITVPKTSEQTVRSVENIFAVFAGLHSPFSWAEKWIDGATQSAMSVEIASIDGRVSFYTHSERRMRDLVEAAIYAQYPDADIDEVEDYALKVPSHYPDEEVDVWGAEMMPVKPDAYPLRTYLEFEDKVSGEFKDPLASLLESFSRMSPGEQIWYQIVLYPTDQKSARERAEKLIKKLKGEKEVVKRTVLDEVLDLPMNVAKEFLTVALGSGEAKKVEKKKEDFPKLFALSPGERSVLEAIERKAAKIGFMCKIRIVYIAKKEVFKKAKAAQPFIGFMKQMNTFDMQAYKPESKKIGVNGTLLWFKKRRNNQRKMKLIRAYRRRHAWVGLPQRILSIEELATLWHFPILLQVKAPSLLRTEAKKSEAPANVPFG